MSEHDEIKRRLAERAPMPWWWLGQRDPVARFTFALVLATIGLLAAGLLQYLILKAQLAQAVQDRADAAADEQLDKRAWVGLQSAVGVPGTFTSTVPWQVNFTFLNSGKTPAREVRIAAETYHSPTPVDGPPLDAIKLLYTKLSRSRAVAPQGQLTWGINTASNVIPSATASASEIKTLVDLYLQFCTGLQIEYNYGILYYKDVYGHEHSTTFCIYMADPKTQTLAFCKDFNDLN